MLVRFFTRKDFGGWRKYAWLPVSLVQGKYVHCEIEVEGVILNADNKHGVVCRPSGPFTPRTLLYVPHDASAYKFEANNILGKKYSWEAFFSLLLPRWGDDPKGMICSELVAHMISLCAVDERYRLPFITIPPHRWTPNAIYQALLRLSNYIDN